MEHYKGKDHHNGVKAYFQSQDELELEQMKTEHGAAAVHPINAYKHSHTPPPKVRPKSLKVVKRCT